MNMNKMDIPSHGMGWDIHFSHIKKPPEEPYMTSASGAQSGDNSSLNSSNLMGHANQGRQGRLPWLNPPLAIKYWVMFSKMVRYQHVKMPF